MSDTNTTKIVFDEDKVSELLTSVFNSVNIRITDRITQDVTNSDKHHTPSAEAIKAYVDNAIKEAIADVKKEFTDKINAVKSYSVDLSIETTAWLSDSDANYPYYVDITVENATGDEFMSVILDNTSLVVAGEAGISSSCEISEGKCRLRSERVPSSKLTGIIRVEP